MHESMQRLRQECKEAARVTTARKQVTALLLRKTNDEEASTVLARQASIDAWLAAQVKSR